MTSSIKFSHRQVENIESDISGIEFELNEGT